MKASEAIPALFLRGKAAAASPLRVLAAFFYIISRAPFGHTPNDTGSNTLLLLAAYMPPLRIAMKGLRPLHTTPQGCMSGASVFEAVVRLRIQTFQLKLRICARRFPKDDRKALWRGVGAELQAPIILSVAASWNDRDWPDSSFLIENVRESLILAGKRRTCAVDVTHARAPVPFATDPIKRASFSLESPWNFASSP